MVFGLLLFESWRLVSGSVFVFEFEGFRDYFRGMKTGVSF